MQELVDSLTSLQPLWIYCAIAAVCYVENIFPPFPSDVVLVAGGSLIGLGRIDFALALTVATAGSTLGFLTMYKVGDWLGDTILEKGKIKFIPPESVLKVEEWFKVHGYWIIVGNRFLAGTRAVVSFFAGMSELPVLKTTILSFVSALIWNSILLFSGKALGEHWSEIIVYLETYGKVMTSLVVLVVIVALARYFYKKKAQPKSPGENS